MAEGNLVNYVPKTPSLLKARPVLNKDTGEHDGKTWILPMSRVVFVAADKPFVSSKRQKENKAKGKDPRDGENYSISVVTPPQADITPFKASSDALNKTAFGKVVGMKAPWIRAEEKHEPAPMGVVSLEGFWKINANSYRGPIPVKNAKLDPVPVAEYAARLYPGCFVCIEVELATFDNETKGVKAYLKSIQIIKDGPKLSEEVSGGDAYEAVSEDDDAAVDAAFA